MKINTLIYEKLSVERLHCVLSTATNVCAKRFIIEGNASAKRPSINYVGNIPNVLIFLSCNP